MELLDLIKKLDKKLDRVIERLDNTPQGFKHNEFIIGDEDYDKCPNCGEGKMIGNMSEVFASLPPKYKYTCNECDYMEIK